MAEPSTHINYSFEDIQRYLQGKMSAVEMHGIEKAALQDPFLADAIEGFNEADLTKAQQHLNEINATLLKEKKESKVVAFNKRSQWLNIAAVVIVLAGIGVVASYFFKSPDQQNNITQVKNKPAENKALKDSTTTEVNALSAKPDTTSFIAENKTSKKTEPSVVKKNIIKKDIADDNVTEENQEDIASVAAAPVQLNQNNISSMMDTVSYSLKAKRLGYNQLPATFSGKIIDENNKPIEGVLVQSKDKKEAAVTDANGDFSLQKNDTVLNVTAGTVGYTSENRNLEAGNNNMIKLRATNSYFNDVVVTTALGTSKKQKTSSDSVMPVGGWQNFNNYVLTKLNKDTTAASITNADDLVELEFSVDNNGNPYNIRITKPLDDQRNAKAIDILKNGPRWTSTSKKKKAKVAISF